MTGFRSPLVRVLLVILVFVALAILVARVEVGRDLSRLRVGFASGTVEGNYHAVVDRIAGDAKARNGDITNVATAGSVDNVRALAASCDVAFALVQDGELWPPGKLVLLGKLPRAETVFFLGKDADKLDGFAALRGMRIGIGPEGSGAAKIAREILQGPDFQALGLALTMHPLAEQLELAQKGELDLAVMVMDEDAPLVVKAVREEGLQIASFPHAEVMVGHVPGVHTGRIPAGRYDAVRVLPSVDKSVLQLDTLIVGNGCASRSRTIDLLGVVSEVFPEFGRINKAAANTSGLPLSPAAKSYFENDGPEVFDTYAPWLVDIMPPGKWVYIVTALSLLFNAMGFGHRFQLWRIDTARVHLEKSLTNYFGATATLGDIARMTALPKDNPAETRAGCDRIVHELEALAEKCRKQSLSILVPMGQEMAYRYQEEIIHETLGVLRAYIARVG